MQQYILADVFTSTPFQGNPLAVFPDATGLSASTMQLIARELNLSETAFVMAPDEPDATHAVRIFTPTQELPFAGHPTIGTAVVLRHLMIDTPRNQTVEMRFQEGIGTIPVRIDGQADDGFTATLTVAGASVQNLDVAPSDIAELLGIEVSCIAYAELQPAAVTNGVSFAMIPLRSLEDLGRCALRLDRWRELLQGKAAAQVYPFYLDPATKEGHVRMFAPAFGQPEDSGTGAAAAALGSFVSQSYGLDQPSEWVIRQGAYIGRCSTLSVRVYPQTDGPGRVELGGTATIIGEGRILANLAKHS